MGKQIQNNNVSEILYIIKSEKINKLLSLYYISLTLSTVCFISFWQMDHTQNGSEGSRKTLKA